MSSSTSNQLENQPSHTGRFINQDTVHKRNSQLYALANSVANSMPINQFQPEDSLRKLERLQKKIESLSLNKSSNKILSPQTKTQPPPVEPPKHSSSSWKKPLLIGTGILALGGTALYLTSRYTGIGQENGVPTASPAEDAAHLYDLGSKIGASLYEMGSNLLSYSAEQAETVYKSSSLSHVSEKFSETASTWADSFYQMGSNLTENTLASLNDTFSSWRSFPSQDSSGFTTHSMEQFFRDNPSPQSNSTSLVQSSCDALVSFAQESHSPLLPINDPEVSDFSSLQNTPDLLSSSPDPFLQRATQLTWERALQQGIDSALHACQAPFSSVTTRTPPLQIADFPASQPPSALIGPSPQTDHGFYLASQATQQVIQSVLQTGQYALDAFKTSSDSHTNSFYYSPALNYLKDIFPITTYIAINIKKSLINFNPQLSQLFIHKGACAIFMSVGTWSIINIVYHAYNMLTCLNFVKNMQSPNSLIDEYNSYGGIKLNGMLHFYSCNFNFLKKQKKSKRSRGGV